MGYVLYFQRPQCEHHRQPGQQRRQQQQCGSSVSMDQRERVQYMLYAWKAVHHHQKSTYPFQKDKNDK